MVNDDLKVSIIIPLYNVEKYVTQCIQSACDQTYHNIEIILVDDESKDNSGQIADSFSEKDNRIRVIHKKNGGVSSARNVGIDASTGDYICFIDGDDFVAKDYVEYMLSLALKYDVKLVIVPQVMGTFNERQAKSYSESIITPEDGLEKLLCYRIRVGCYSKLFEKNFIGDDLRFSSELVMGEGFTFNSIAIQKATKIAIGTKKVYYYRRDNVTSATSKFHRKRFENGLYALEVIRDNIVYKTPRIMKAWEYAFWRTHSDVYDAIVLAKAENDCRDLYERCLMVVKSRGLAALTVPIVIQDRIRAIAMMIYPKAIPMAMRIRKKIYHIGRGE